MQNRLLALLLVPVLSSALGAEVRRTPPVSILEENEDGYLILKVSLHDRARGSRTFRFLLDTGAATTMIDRTVPDRFFWDVQGIKASAVDGTSKEDAVQAVTLKRVDVAGLLRDEVPAMRMDLKNSMLGRMQDEPVDGILGMSFMRNTRFLLDAKGKRVVWGAAFPEGERHRIQIGPDDHACLDLKANGRTLSAILDTGNGGGLILPKSAVPAGSVAPGGVSTGIHGNLVPNFEARLDVAAGGRGWRSVAARLEEAEDCANLGLRIFKAGPTYFDFTFKLLVLPSGPQGSWAILPEEPSRKLTLAWTRRVGKAWLEVLHVVPGSAFERAGLRAGDQLVKVGSLEGAVLSLRSVGHLLSAGQACTWIVRRSGKEHRFEVRP